MNNKLKKFMCLILTFVLAFTLSGELPAIADSGETIISVPITVQEEYDLASDFFTLLNQKRAEAGLPQYKLDAGLMEMAMQRGAQLCVYFGHNSLYSSNAAVTDLRKGTPIEKTVNVTEDIAEGLANASSAYTVWYDSLGHRPALISTDYNYCGIGVVTYEGKIEWSLIVSQYPCGNTIDGVSGTKTNTRTINAYPKYFGKGAKIYADAETDYYMGENHYIGADGWTIKPFRFCDISDNSYGYIVRQGGLFTFKSSDPDLFDVDGIGRIKPKAKGEGTVTVYYKGIELCSATVVCTIKPTETVTPTPSPEPTVTEKPEPTPTKTPENTATPTPKPTATPTPKPTVTPTQKPSANAPKNEIVDGYYYQSNGQKYSKKNSLVQIDGKWYWADSKAKVSVCNGAKGNYYFKNGVMQKNKVIKSYYYQKNGKKYTKKNTLVKIKSKYYWADSKSRVKLCNGAKKNYYFVKGVMQKNKVVKGYYYQKNGKKYSGKAKKIKISGKWYKVTSKGKATRTKK